MDRMVYLAASATTELMKAQAVHMHNLSNISTPGFRADLVQYTSNPVSTDPQNARVFSSIDTLGADFTAGNISTTGKDLDIAITGDGWIAVLDEAGNEGYTRSGNLQISSEGILQTGSGFMVQGNGGPIAIPPAQAIEIGNDGTISVLPSGQSATSLVQLNRIKLVNPPQKNLAKDKNGLLYQTNKATASADDSVRITKGALEGSNVDAVGTLLTIMDISRQYEINIQMMKKAQDASDGSARIMQIAT